MSSSLFVTQMQDSNDDPSLVFFLCDRTLHFSRVDRRLNVTDFHLSAASFETEYPQNVGVKMFLTLSDKLEFTISSHERTKDRFRAFNYIRADADDSQWLDCTLYPVQILGSEEMPQSGYSNGEITAWP